MQGAVAITEGPCHPFSVPMDWTDVKYFLVVARDGGLSGPARKLKVSASTLSRRVARFERDLGARLFDRTPSGYALNERGRALLGDAEAVEAAALALRQRALGLDESLRGTVRLAAPETVASALLAPNIDRILARHDGLRIEVITGIPTVFLSRREADLALRLVRPTQGELLVRPAGSWGHGLYAARSYLERFPGVRRAPLDAEHLVGWDDGNAHLPPARWLRQKIGGRHLSFAASSLGPQIQAVEAGVGIGMLPCLVGRRSKSLLELQPPSEVLVEKLWLVTHLQLRDDVRVRAVQDFVRDVLADHESWLS